MNYQDRKKTSRVWEDFEVVKSGGLVSARKQYESYKLFKEKLSEIPKRELLEKGFLHSQEDEVSFSKFFHDFHYGRSEALYRKSESSDELFVDLWLSKVRGYAEVGCFSRSVSDFNGVSKEKLSSIAKLSVEPSVIYELPRVLADLGILLVYQKGLPGMKLDGAAFKLETGNPVIGLSIRYARLDNFWFTLMHELSHVCLHYDLLDNPILDDLEKDNDSAIEVSANRLAKSSFIPRSVWRNCPPKYDKSPEALIRFANEVSVHPAIVAGMLRKESGDYRIYSEIVNEVSVREELFRDD